MKFTQWDIPFALIPLKSYEVETRINWRAAALKAFPSVSKSRVDILTKAYWKKHAHKQFVSTQHFLNDLTLAIGNRYPMACVQLRHDLIALLTQIFVLQMHGFTDILNCSPIFEEWTSINPLTCLLVPNCGNPLFYMLEQTHFSSMNGIVNLRLKVY